MEVKGKDPICIPSRDLSSEFKETSAVVGFVPVQDLINIVRVNSPWFFMFGIACCAIEGMMAPAMPRFDCMRFGMIPRNTPRQSDIMIIAGTIPHKLVPAIKTLYDQMPAPKWVMALGNCAISGGPFSYDGQYAIVNGANKIIPVDVYVPGCPPRPEAFIQGILKLQTKMSKGIIDANVRAEKRAARRAKK
jgi:NADH-quinone oxidoreductase subunit B